MNAPVGEGKPLRRRVAFLAYLLPTLLRLKRLLREEQIEVVNVHYFDRLWLYFFLLRRVLDFRLVVSVHGSDVLGKLGPRNVKYLEERVNSLDRVVYCSDGFRRQVVSVSSPLWPKSTPILNGIELVETFSRKHETGDYIVCVAHLREHKAQDVLLRAFHEMKEEFPDVRAEMLGEGPLRRSLRQRVRDAPESGVRPFDGDVPRARALELIAGAK